MQCPKCKHESSKVIDSRVGEQGRTIRRRRECDNCERRFSTVERRLMSTLMVKKKDGTMEPYNRVKLEQGLHIACGKRPVSQEQLDNMVTKLEEKWSANKKEITSVKIGADVMDALKKLDHIAYIRFASVYRSFKDVDEFKEELGKLLK